jgi:hypothetical protein
MKLDHQDRNIVLAFCLFMGFWTLLFTLIGSQVLETAEIEPRERLLPLNTDSQLWATQTPVQVGAYIENIYKFSPDDQTFNAEGRIWLNWPEAAQTLLLSNGLAPEKWLNWVNQLDGWDFKLEPTYPQPQRLQNGLYHQSFKFSGAFYAHNMDFRRYPFQKVDLPLTLELTETLTKKGDHGLFLVPDEPASGVGGFISLMGYKTTAFTITHRLHEYGSDFGARTSPASAERVRLPQVDFLVSYQQSPNAALLTLILPLTVVMALVLFSPSLSSSLWDVRLGIPPTALLTLIFLQQSYKEKLPNLPYATFLDLVYNVCYFVNLILFALFLWASNRLHETTEQSRPSVIARIDILDRYVQMGLVLLLVSMIAWHWFRLTGLTR